MAKANFTIKVVALTINGETRVHDFESNMSAARAKYDEECDEEDTLVVSLLRPGKNNEWSLARSEARGR